MAEKWVYRHQGGGGRAWRAACRAWRWRGDARRGSPRQRNGAAAQPCAVRRADATALAAAYAYGIARNHPFADGNKRTAAVVSETCLALNGYRLNASDAELVVAFVALAAGQLSEEELADWFRQHLAAG